MGQTSPGPITIFTTCPPSSQRDREGYLAGVRIDISAVVAVKVEYRHQRSDEDPYVNAAHVQVAFAF